MNKFAKLAVVTAAALASTPAIAAPVGVTPGSEPVARARIIKPLTLSAVGTLNFGDIVIPAGGVTADRLIRLNATTGVIAAADCGGGSAEVVCSGVTSVPTYTVTGTQGQQVNVTKTASDLTNQNDGTTLQMTPTGIDDLVLTNSGAPGDPFTIGGDITITSTTTDGLYLGSVDVTVDYN